MVQGKAMQIVDISNPNADKITSASTTNAVISNKQSMTAVEWLFEQIPSEWSSSMSAFEALQQAKQIEKEQIINAWRNGENDSMYEPKQLDEQAEQYYNETYKQ